MIFVSSAKFLNADLLFNYFDLRKLNVIEMRSPFKNRNSVDLQNVSKMLFGHFRSQTWFIVFIVKIEESLQKINIAKL